MTRADVIRCKKKGWRDNQIPQVEALTVFMQQAKAPSAALALH